MSWLPFANVNAASLINALQITRIFGRRREANCSEVLFHRRKRWVERRRVALVGGMDGRRNLMPVSRSTADEPGLIEKKSHDRSWRTGDIPAA